MLAAEHGNFEILQLFIDYNNEVSFNTKQLDSVLNSSTSKAKGLKAIKGHLKHTQMECKFDRWTKSNETVLHMVLKRPLLKCLNIENQETISKFDAAWNNLQLKAKALETKYNKCMGILLASDLESSCNDQALSLIHISEPTRPY